jgi:cyclophilin family peptidyl-prolyl cis-trans isomerase
MNTLNRTLTLLATAALFGLAGCGPDSSSSSSSAPPPAPAANTPAPSADTPVIGKVPIVIETSMGTIEAELDADKAPISVTNFVHYIKKGHYDGTVFHRIIPTFMIQGGGFDEQLKEKSTDAPIKNESQNGLHNERGTLAMARTSDPDSATSQFFINVVDNTAKLDYPNPDGVGYAVFGKVTKGMDIVDKIKDVATTSKELTQNAGGQEIKAPAEDVPVENVVIKSIKLADASKPAGDEAAPSSGGNTPDSKGNSPADEKKGTK